MSAAVIGDVVLRPLLWHLLGSGPRARETVRARLCRKVPSRLGMEEFVRVALGRVGANLVAAPMARGAGAITSLSRAYGVLRVPAMREGFDADTWVEVELLVDRSVVEEAVLAVGSHDPALDLAGDLLSALHPGARLASASVGSLAGLFAVKSGECHVAGSHLLDPATGEYNLPDIGRHIPGTKVELVTLAHRSQGLMVPRANPKGLRSIEDLARPGVVFVNRQRGSGTRVLLDHELSRRGLEGRSIRGYEREEFTHAAVAAAVASGAADAGLGVFAAARALDLDFLPLAEERYELVMTEESAADRRVKRLLDVVRSDAFKSALASLGGYDSRETGRVRPSL